MAASCRRGLSSCVAFGAVLACTTAALIVASASARSAAPLADNEIAGVIDGQSSIPGALPRGFRYVYADDFRGWPVAPLHAEHPIRGAFLDPRLTPHSRSFHFGVDIAVDDAKRDRGAPPGRSHRVYALEGGAVRIIRNRPGQPCASRRVEVAHFSYWHVAATVRQNSWVRAGEPIGWTCSGQWHVHISEWAQAGATLIWVNPLHRGGKLAPYVDTMAPVIHSLRFENGRGVPLHTNALSGSVDLLVRADDPQSFLGWLGSNPNLVLPGSPYRLGVTIRDRRGHLLLHRIAFQADQLPPTPFTLHYGPGTSQSLLIGECLETACRKSERASFVRPLSRYHRELWDTTRVSDGRYTVTVSAWDIRGNVSSSRLRVIVTNH